MTDNNLLANKFFKKIWMVLAVLIIVAAVFSSVFRALTPWAKQYKGEVEQHLTSLLGQPVTVQTMETGWYWFEPVVKLKHIRIHDGHNKSIYLDRLIVGVNLFKSLWNWRIQPGVLYIDDMHLVFREKDGHWCIEGISRNAMKDTDITPEKTREILDWLAQQEKLIVRHVSAHLHFNDGSLIPVNELNLSIVNKGGNYKIKGEARLEQTNATVFQLLGNVQFDPSQIKNTNGRFYFSAINVLPAQWQNLLPKSSMQLEGGKGNVSLWVDLEKGNISSIQAELRLKRLAWKLLNKKNSKLIQSFYANMGWKLDKQGWQFQADHMKLRVAGVTWPENQLSIRFNKNQNTYQIFTKSLIVESLLSEAINWPPAIQNVLQLKPHGILSDVQVLIKENQINYILTRFDQLGWRAKDNIPGVSNLSGVLNWQPTEGRLELDSENSTFDIKGYPAQKLTIFNGAFDWKELNDGLRLSIERLVASQPELTISLEGAIDQLTQNSVGNIRLVGNFSGKNLQKWMPYLPKKHMKAKLFAWLNNDIKRLGQATGKITINGMAKDFPFDNGNGEFSIVSHVVGGDILITPEWRLIKDLEGYIKLKNRNLDIDIIDGDAQGTLLKQMNLRIDDIGKDRETLLIHGIVHGKAQQMLNFVMNSPLKKKLSALKILLIKGMLSLNLRLEIPLYPENDDNLARGELTFENNIINIKHQMGDFSVRDVTGNLLFNEKGIQDSALTARAFGYPLNIKIQSEKSPQPLTAISIEGECTVESLKKKWHLPIFSVLKGNILAKALLKITDDPNDLDNMKLSSDLIGLAVDLPAPLGKTYKEKTPLQVNLDFNPQKTLRLRVNYNGRLSTDLLMQKQKGVFKLKSGQIRLGSAQAVNQDHPGLGIAGTLDGFDLQAWKEVINRFSKENVNPSLLSLVNIIDVKMGKLNFLNQQFDNMSLYAKKRPDNDWSINLKQKKVDADLTYHSATNSLSGFVKYLHLSEIGSSKNNKDTPSHTTPGQIPNLNLRVDNFSIGKIQIGNITLKSHSTSEQWKIDYCRIDSPYYQANFEGEWLQKGKFNQTKLQSKMYLKDLAKSLDRWAINPAVDAGKGYIEFHGGWQGSLYDFSLSKLNGSMYLQLKNGRITHLSPETEEKLGLGKLLSILSLQTIPRRLKLDFSDLSNDGYSFDIFKGNFNVNNGIMSTNNSYIDGPVAYASMKGDLDLVRRLYDLDLNISPHITASLPVVATIAGGPIAGLAAWIANKIINQSMQKIAGYSYKISGHWDQPIVQQLNIVKKLP
ncbi:YhdP family protein [Legionella pneumophila]|uniref:YhdP family protein n=1 Tax=Legionella pneumophila TaxID=446 RepID=UPI0036F4890D